MTVSRVFCQCIAVFVAVELATGHPATNETCTIPNQEPPSGVCTKTNQCAPYVNLRDKGNFTIPIISFMRQIQCEDAPGHVCCTPDNSDYQKPRVALNLTMLKSPPPALTNPIEQRFGETEMPPDVGEGNDEECGIYTDQRIIGGEIAGLDDYPWTALLIYNSSHQYGCSGAIIDKRYILTAAHCVTGPTVARKGNLVKVRLGEYDTQGNPDCIQERTGYDCADDAVDIDVEKVIVHPYYQGTNLNQHHDIALIKLKQEIKYSIYIAPLCLPTKNLGSGVKPGVRMTLAGWGATDRFQSRLGNILSPIKLFTEVPVVNQTVCQTKFNSANLTLGLGQLCAGGEKDIDSCPGDSGGPLMYFNHEANRYVSAGIVSLGKDEKGKLACGEEGFPGVYTRTDQYVDWILNAKSHN